MFYLLGGITDARIVVGPVDDDVRPPEPVWKEIVESHEALGIGTIFWHKDEPKIHFLGTYGKFDNVKAGCLRDKGKAFLIMEVVIIEMSGTREKVGALMELLAPYGVVELMRTGRIAMSRGRKAT